MRRNWTFARKQLIFGFLFSIVISQFLLIFMTVIKLGNSFTSELMISDEIREYFGEEISIYFAFLGHYTLALVPPAVIGILQLISSVDTIHEYAFFAIFNLIWVTLFLESWRRNCCELAYNWGTIGTDSEVPEPRSNYYGPMDIDAVTGRYQSHYPAWKRYLKVHTLFINTELFSCCCFF